MNLLEKIKQHWKVILICLLTVLWMNRCSVACSRDTEINKLEDFIEFKDSVIIEKDSLIKEISFELDMKNALLDSEKSHNSNFTSIASDNQTILHNKIRTLSEENRRLKSLANSLSKEIETLKEQLDTTKTN